MRGGAVSACIALMHADDRHGDGWVFFAGTMLFLVGGLNWLYGIAAISDSHFFTRDVTYVLGDLTTAGWLLLAFGVVQVVAAISIWARSGWGRWVGLGSATGNAVLQLLAIPGEPELAIAMFTMDLLVVYGLITYGAALSAPAPSAR